MARTKEGNGDPFKPLWMLARQVQKKSNTKSEHNTNQSTEDDLHLRRLGCRRRTVCILLSLWYSPQSTGIQHCYNCHHTVTLRRTATAPFTTVVVRNVIITATVSTFIVIVMVSLTSLDALVPCLLKPS